MGNQGDRSYFGCLEGQLTRTTYREEEEEEVVMELVWVVYVWRVKQERWEF